LKEDIKIFISKSQKQDLLYMDFKDQIAQLASRVEKMLPQIQTEEATKNALVMPFLQIVG
jgi:hypothetical protein